MRIWSKSAKIWPIHSSACSRVRPFQEVGRYSNLYFTYTSKSNGCHIHTVCVKTCRLFFLPDHMKQFALVTFQKRATVVGLGPSNSSHRAYSPECEPKHYHVTVTFTNSEARQIFCKNFWLHRMVFNIELTCSNNEKVPSSRETLEWQEKGRRIS